MGIQNDSVVEAAGRENDEETVYGLFAWCEGCDSRHYIPVVALDLPNGQHQPKWEWNQSYTSPTFSPSILIYEYEGHHPRCHSFIRDGEWEYLSDCTHRLAGQKRKLLIRDQWPEETWPNE